MTRTPAPRRTRGPSACRWCSPTCGRNRLANAGVAVHAMHPGWVDTPGVRTYLPKFRTLTRPVIRTPEQGADTLVWLLATGRTTPWSGGFWHDRAPRPVHYSRRTTETRADRDRFMARCDEDVASYVEPDPGYRPPPSRRLSYRPAWNAAISARCERRASTVSRPRPGRAPPRRAPAPRTPGRRCLLVDVGEDRPLVGVVAAGRRDHRRAEVAAGLEPAGVGAEAVGQHRHVERGEVGEELRVGHEVVDPQVDEARRRRVRAAARRARRRSGRRRAPGRRGGR